MHRLYCLGVAFCLVMLSAYGASAANLAAPTRPAAHGYISAAATDAVVIVNKANLREKPTTHSKRLAQLVRGTKVSVLDKEGKWAHVAVNGTNGYVFAALLK
ncbi:MAG: SH3 domain-containing protein [Rhodospirillaceae bacterium]|nr:SH3 domain-containing protein [Rhodospirillaceae bacterium]